MELKVDAGVKEHPCSWTFLPLLQLAISIGTKHMKETQQ